MVVGGDGQVRYCATLPDPYRTDLNVYTALDDMENTRKNSMKKK